MIVLFIYLIIFIFEDMYYKYIVSLFKFGQINGSSIDGDDYKAHLKHKVISWLC